MRKLSLFFVFILAASIFHACQNKQVVNQYPEAKKSDHVDNYHGTEVKDPYRWMEETESDATKKWVQEEVAYTNKYLEKIPFRQKIEDRYTKLWNYEKYSAPSKKGKYYVFSKNDGLQEQSVLYIQEGLDGEPKVLLDPNTFSEDGTVSLAGTFFSKDYKYVSYSLSRGGSDWREFHVMEVETGKKLDDVIHWSKFSGNSWFKDGFYYSAYDKPEGENKLKVKVDFQKLYYHKLGTSQDEDTLIIENKDNPKQGFGGYVTEDQTFLIIDVWEGSATSNKLYYQRLNKENADIVRLIDTSEAKYNYVENEGDTLFILTNYDAPNYRLVAVDLKNPEKENWKTIIPESENKMQSVSYVDGKFFVSWLKDANTQIEIFDNTGVKQGDVKLPGIGSVRGFGGEKMDKELFYTFTSFTYPPTIFRYDVEKNESTLFREPKVDFNSDDYVTDEKFYESKDGTKVPLFITYKKGTRMDGSNPTLLYAYGGFNIAMTPSFRLTMIPLLENGGIYAMACLRGGSEYGEKWHEAGMLDKKQNVFDDFIAAGEYLIANQYTSKDNLALMGGSNGGTLIGAVINQRPDLCKVAFPIVGVMDMLRFHKFTIGWAWVSEYGSSDDAEQFKTLIKYSPYHNVKKGLNYPATMVLTADHDDRVFPAHSFKYAAALQDAYKGPNPVLIRIETKAGHGAGTSTSKTIREYTDMLSFMYYNMGITPNY